MKFQYTYLLPNNIRVFRFSEHATPSFIHIWLDHLAGYRNENASSYTTIACLPKSSDNSDRESIVLNGRSFLVPAALFNALRTVLTYHHEPNTRYWAEDICINHADDAEEAQRVLMVALANENAERVWLWTDDGDEGTSRALGTIQERREKQDGAASLSEAEQTAVQGLLQRLSVPRGEISNSRDESKEVVICGMEQCPLSLLRRSVRRSDEVLTATSVL